MLNASLAAEDSKNPPDKQIREKISKFVDEVKKSHESPDLFKQLLGDFVFFLKKMNPPLNRDVIFDYPITENSQVINLNLLLLGMLNPDILTEVFRLVPQPILDEALAISQGVQGVNLVFEVIKKPFASLFINQFKPEQIKKSLERENKNNSNVFHQLTWSPWVNAENNKSFPLIIPLFSEPELIEMLKKRNGDGNTPFQIESYDYAIQVSNQFPHGFLELQEDLNKEENSGVTALINSLPVSVLSKSLEPNDLIMLGIRNPKSFNTLLTQYTDHEINPLKDIEAKQAACLCYRATLENVRYLIVSSPQIKINLEESLNLFPGCYRKFSKSKLKKYYKIEKLKHDTKNKVNDAERLNKEEQASLVKAYGMLSETIKTKELLLLILSYAAKAYMFDLAISSLPKLPASEYRLFAHQAVEKKQKPSEISSICHITLR